MTERDLFRDIIYPQFRHFGIIKQVENAIAVGMSDCSYCLRFKESVGSGWIELKKATEWPKRYETVVRFNHFKLDQVIFIESWYKAGGRACILAQVENDFMLIPASGVRAIFEGVNKTTFLSLAVVHGHETFPTGRMLKWLCE